MPFSLWGRCCNCRQSCVRNFLFFFFVFSISFLFLAKLNGFEIEVLIASVNVPRRARLVPLLDFRIEKESTRGKNNYWKPSICNYACRHSMKISIYKFNYTSVQVLHIQYIINANISKHGSLFCSTLYGR